jgi:P27 family predicted phage terminase small subunit
MNDSKMNIVHMGQGKDTLACIEKVPAHLDAAAKKCYKEVGNFLAKIDRLRETNLHTLESFATAYSQYVFACGAINRKNKNEYGSGYIQKFESGASNVSTEVVLRDKATVIMLNCSKLFGLDPKSEKELKGMVDSGQLNMLDDFERNRLAR